MSTAKIDKVKIPRNQDGRYALTKEDEEHALVDLKIMSRREVSEKWNISPTKIYYLLNPEKYKAQLEKNKGLKIYDKEKARIYKQKNRAKKRNLLENEQNKGV